jgi:hypothetical protein
MARATAPILDSTVCEMARSRMDFRFRGKSGHAADVAAMTEFDPSRTLGGEFCCAAQQP